MFFKQTKHLVRKYFYSFKFLSGLPEPPIIKYNFVCYTNFRWNQIGNQDRKMLGLKNLWKITFKFHVSMTKIN